MATSAKHNQQIGTCCYAIDALKVIVKSFNLASTSIELRFHKFLNDLLSILPIFHPKEVYPCNSESKGQLAFTLRL
ncbi:MAG: hypothetical protein RMJ31_00330 [Nitrososphaerota archaeon]|nr:hypothetical protein [Nitrososphaerota archaeon]